LVTVLFCDIEGSTELGDRLDPEALRGVIVRFFEVMREVVVRHHGTVDKFVGDGVMAVFGVPQLHEDDALRAVRAAIEMREALEELNEHYDRAFRLRLSIRIGINSGEILVGDALAGQGLVLGDAANLAARLEKAAPVGEIVIGLATQRLVRHAVGTEPVGPLLLKGKPEPIPAFRVLPGQPPVPLWAGPTPTIGREVERSLLLASYRRAVETRACQLVTVVGPAGIGKSRLATEVSAALAAEAGTIRGRCLPYGEAITFWPLVEALKQIRQLSELEDEGAFAARLADLLADERDAEPCATCIAQLLGVADGGASIEETFWSVCRLLDHLSRRQPLVLVFDDVQWAAPAFLDLVEYLTRRCSAPVLIACLARPELFELRPDWPTHEPATTLISLEPLSDEESVAHIERLLGGGRLDADLQQRITRAAQGIPLYVEELLSALMHEGVLRRRNGDWLQSSPVSQLAVPPTIQALLATRLEQFDAGERALLERASIEGEVFHIGALAALAPEVERREAEPLLRGLVAKKLITPAPSSMAGEQAFRFHHLLLRDVVYDSLPKHRRASLHERFAEWLAVAAKGRIREYEEILAHHLEQAVGYRAALGSEGDLASLSTRAAGHLASAGRRAADRGDAAAAANLLGRAVALLPPADGDHRTLLTDLGEALLATGELPRAQDVLDEAIDAARADSDAEREWHARIVRLAVQMQLDPDVEAMREELEAGIRFLEERGAERALAQAWLLMGSVHNMGCSGELALAALERALVHADRGAAARDRSVILCTLAALAPFGPTPVDENVRRLETILAEAVGHSHVEAAAQGALCWMHGACGRFDEARRLGALAHATLERLGLRVALARLSMRRAWVELFADDPGAAEALLREGHTVLAEIGENSHRSSVAAYLAHALWAQGRDDDAYRFTEMSEEASASGDVISHVVWRGARAKVLARRGVAAEAERLARDGADRASRTDYLVMRGESLLDLAEVLRVAGRPAEAIPVVREALELFERKGNRVLIEKTRSELAGLMSHVHA
jgi:class 3 adenylate cyclase